MLGFGQSVKKIGSKVSGTAMRNAESIASGMNKKALKIPEYHVMKKSPRSMLRGGSRAGLRDEKTVHLITNDSGYMNPAHHQARYRPKREPVVVTNNTTSSSMMYNGMRRSVCNDFRLAGSCTNSLMTLRKIVG